MASGSAVMVWVRDLVWMLSPSEAGVKKGAELCHERTAAEENDANRRLRKIRKIRRRAIHAWAKFYFRSR